VKDAIAQVACVVDDDIDTSKLLDRSFNDVVRAGATRNAVCVWDSLATGLDDFIDDLLGRTGTGAFACTTFAPAAAMANAIPRPIPPPAPVTTATLPANIPLI
jgi:hypothetical protein